MVKKLKEIFDILKGEEKLILSVAAAEDKEVLKAVKDAVENQIIEHKFNLQGNLESARHILVK